MLVNIGGPAMSSNFCQEEHKDPSAAKKRSKACANLSKKALLCSRSPHSPELRGYIGPLTRFARSWRSVLLKATSVTVREDEDSVTCANI